MSTLVHTAPSRRTHAVRRIAGPGLIVDPFRPATGVVELLGPSAAPHGGVRFARRSRAAARRSLIEQMLGRPPRPSGGHASFQGAGTTRYHTRYAP